jgi:hypothetical protein
MDILKTPFAILGATPRDSRQKITELADERSLIIDTDVCAEVRSILTHPRKRLASEIAWFPGVNAGYIAEMLSLLETIPPNDSMSVFDTLSNQELGITPMAMANFLAARLSRLPSSSLDKLRRYILGLAQYFEKINVEELIDVLNEDRAIAGFSEITDISVVEAEIQERRYYYVDIIKSALDNLSTKDLVEVLTEITEGDDNNDTVFPYLISDILDIYETAAQPFFAKETENIKNLAQILLEGLKASRPDSTLKEKSDQLAQVIRNWVKIAKPLIIRAKTMGVYYEDAWNLVNFLRDLSLCFYNQHKKAEFSLQISHLLMDEFSDIEEAAKRFRQDIATLEKIVEDKSKPIYEAYIGFPIKKTLRISSEGIEWQERLWSLETITRIKWGGIRRQGMLTWTSYTIFWGTDIDSVAINVNEVVYNEFVHCLWNAVGVRLMIECLEGLQSGKTYRFASVQVNDFGINMVRRKFFSTEQVFCKWEDMVFFNGNGTFCVGSKLDKRVSTSFSYLQDDNTHVLEAMIRMLWDRGEYRYKLSSVLTAKN